MKMAGIIKIKKCKWRENTHIQTPQMKIAGRQTSDSKPLLLCTSKMEAVELEANEEGRGEDVRVEDRERERQFVGEFVQGWEEDVCVAGNDEREGLESQEQERVQREKEMEGNEREREEKERGQREIEEAKMGLERAREQEEREREQQVLLERERERERESMQKEREEQKGEGQARERQGDRTLATAQVCWFSP